MPDAILGWLQLLLLTPLIAGSVSQAAELPLVALDGGARLIIVNYQPTHLDERADLLIHADVAEILPRMADMALENRESGDQLSG